MLRSIIGFGTIEEEKLMRKIFLTLTAAALVLGVTALSAGAQTQAPVASAADQITFLAN
jgi:hypothetical protein